MNHIHRLPQSRSHFDSVSACLLFLTGGLFLFIVGTLLPVPVQLLVPWLNLCGLLLIYIAVAIFAALYKAKLDDFTEKGDSLF